MIAKMLCVNVKHLLSIVLIVYLGFLRYADLQGFDSRDKSRNDRQNWPTEPCDEARGWLHRRCGQNRRIGLTL